MKRYFLQNRYQDSGWETLSESYDNELEAILWAGIHSRDCFAFGMVRVIDDKKQRVVITFPAGNRNIPFGMVRACFEATRPVSRPSL